MRNSPASRPEDASNVHTRDGARAHDERAHEDVALHLAGTRRGGVSSEMDRHSAGDGRFLDAHESGGSRSCPTESLTGRVAFLGRSASSLARVASARSGTSSSGIGRAACAPVSGTAGASIPGVSDEGACARRTDPGIQTTTAIGRARRGEPGHRIAVQDALLQEACGWPPDRPKQNFLQSIPTARSGKMSWRRQTIINSSQTSWCARSMTDGESATISPDPSRVSRLILV